MNKLVGTLLGIALLAAQGMAESTIDLAGKWAFQLDAKDAGIREGWSTKALSKTIRLPGTTDQAGYGEKTVGADVGVLTRVVKYYGPAWYQKVISIPSTWKNTQTQLLLERVLWTSRVYVDGRDCGIAESLNTPHLHALGQLTPGKHLLTLRIDNRPICPIGVNGHSYTEQTQTVWNGAVGKIQLRSIPFVSIDSIRVFPNAASKRVDAEITIENRNLGVKHVSVRLEIREKATGKIVDSTLTSLAAQNGISTHLKSVSLTKSPDVWDEFAPNLYTLTVTIHSSLGESESTQDFGFRKVARIGQHIAINGKPIFLRGNLDCVHFPLTGYPSMDVSSWTRILKIYKSYGLNHIRFHTWTPPEAAFAAADKLGVYIESEVIWVQRTLGKDVPGPMENMGTSFPLSLLNPPGTVDNYVHSEIRRVMDTYGSHPSFIMFTIGNELGSFDPIVCNQWIEEIKQHDPRRLYAVSTARAIVAADDYSITHAIPGIGWCRDRLEPYNDWDYEKQYSKAPVPIIAHEVGQWPEYPTWDEITKYKGVLRARNYEQFKRLAETNGVVRLDHEFQKASGALAIRLYKDEIESHLRTPSCAGFELLSIQDFSGQGEALVGWLDSFYSSKGTVTPERFRRWCSETVPLARLPKYIYHSDESLSARVQVAHYGAQSLGRISATWYLRDANRHIISHGTFPEIELKGSGVFDIGQVKAKLSPVKTPSRVRLEVHIDGTPFANDWDIWVFPRTTESVTRAVETDLDSAVARLKKGENVLLDAHQLGTRENAKFAQFKPAYWSAAMFQGQFTLGGLVRASHPALSGFPTESNFDWQWQDLCRSGRAFRLDGYPLEYQPIVQPICDFHFNWKLGSIFEMKLVSGGSLLVCGYDITTDLEKRPEAQALRRSLLTYINSKSFAPQLVLTEVKLKGTFPVSPPTLKNEIPVESKPALRIKAGGNLAADGNASWSRSMDSRDESDAAIQYEVDGSGVWKDEVGTAWFGDISLKVSVKIPVPHAYDLYVHFHDWNDLGRDGTVTFLGKTYGLGVHNGTGKWIKLHIRSEDCVAGEVVLQSKTTSGPNLMITELRLVRS